MIKKNYIFGGLAVLGGLIFILSFRKKQKENETVEAVLPKTDFECPYNKYTDPEYIADRERRKEQYNKNNPLAGLFGDSFADKEFKYNTPYYDPYLDCTAEERLKFYKSFDESMNKLKQVAIKGLAPPMLTPQASIMIAKRFGKPELGTAYDPNKNYYKSCGTEQCWVWDGKKWIKEN